MSPAEDDFTLTINRAAGLTLDAACSARAAGQRPLPAPHRRLLKDAIVGLQKAQDALFAASQEPWPQPQPHPQPAVQLELA